MAHVSRNDITMFFSEEHDAATCICFCPSMRLGNMQVLCQCLQVYWMLGPNKLTLCLTYAVLSLMAVLTFGVILLESKDFVLYIVGMVLAIMNLIMLTLTSFRDPGILPKHERPSQSDWTYSDLGESFRPPKTVFCKETQLLVEEYDHFCPWSGTVIGKRNALYFKSFLVTLVALVIYYAGVSYRASFVLLGNGTL